MDLAPPVGAAAPPTVALLTWGSYDSTAWFATVLATVAKVHLIVPDDMSDYVAPDLDARVQIWPFRHARPSQPRAVARMCRQLLRTLRRLDPDVVHMQQGHYAFNLLLGRLGDAPLVVTAHEV